MAADAHGGVHIGRWLSAHVPSYADTFSFAGLGFDKRYSSDPEKAIRNGDFFNCLRGAGEPLLFKFYATHGVKEFDSGSEAPASSNLHVRGQISKQTIRLVLKKDGVLIRQSIGNDLDLIDAKPGVYRVEVYLPSHPLLPADVPWIMSNPIFVREFPPEGLPNLPICPSIHVRYHVAAISKKFRGEFHHSHPRTFTSFDGASR